MKKIIMVLVVLWAIPSYAEVFKSVDQSGTRHFTNDIRQVPAKNRILTTVPEISQGVKSFIPENRSSQHKERGETNHTSQMAISEVRVYVTPAIETYCNRIGGPSYSSIKTCVHRELAAQQFFISHFVPPEIKQYCKALVGESWNLMKTCAQKEIYAKRYLGR